MEHKNVFILLFLISLCGCEFSGVGALVQDKKEAGGKFSSKRQMEWLTPYIPPRMTSEKIFIWILGQKILKM